MASTDGTMARRWIEFSDPSRLPADPLVSVLILTYNQGQYLAQAIEGALMQRTTFPFEVLIGDDCSTDHTRDVALRYQRAHPAIVRVITGDQNVGVNQNLRRVLDASRGRLLAFCEGDDYWTAADKLSRQAAVFAARPEVSMCFHAARVFDHASQRFPRVIDAGRKPRDHTLAEVIAGGGGSIPTASIMLRANALPPMDDWLLECSVGDYPIAIWAASRGVTHSLPQPMAVYRVGVAGSWTSTIVTDIAKDWRHTVSAIAMLEAFPEKAGRRDAEPAVRRMVRRYIRDLGAAHGAIAMRRLPGIDRYLARLTPIDRLFLFACNDPNRLRMKFTWFCISKWRALKRAFRRNAAMETTDQ